MSKSIEAPPGSGTEAEPAGSDDGALFRAAIGPVRRLESRTTAVMRRPRKPLADLVERERQAIRSEMLAGELAVDYDGSELLSFLAPGVSPRVLRQLRRGQFRIGDEFDLHQLTQAEAARALSEFLHQARRVGRRCVRIIHGKGTRSGPRGPVLKALTDRHLRQRGDVLAFCSAPARAGGTGAVLVLLRGP